MKVVLLERVENLGAIGDVVTVKDGFARNFLLPRDKARRATEANLKAFEVERAAIEARNDKNKAESQKIADKIDGQTYVMIRQAGETGQLYGSVAGRDVAETGMPGVLPEAGRAVVSVMCDLSLMPLRRLRCGRDARAHVRARDGPAGATGPDRVHRP